jgi:hypothetical protein
LRRGALAGTQAYGALPDTAAERSLVRRKGEPEHKTRLSEVVWDLAAGAADQQYRHRLRGKRV